MLLMLDVRFNELVLDFCPVNQSWSPPSSGLRFREGSDPTSFFAGLVAWHGGHEWDVEAVLAVFVADDDVVGWLLLFGRAMAYGCG